MSIQRTPAERLVMAQRVLMDVAGALIAHGPQPTGRPGQLPSHHPVFAIAVAHTVLRHFNIPLRTHVGYFHVNGAFPQSATSPVSGKRIMAQNAVVAHAWCTTPELTKDNQDLTEEYTAITDMTVMMGGARGPICVGQHMATEFSVPSDHSLFLYTRPEGTEISGIDAERLREMITDPLQFLTDNAAPHILQFLQDIRNALHEADGRMPAPE